MNKFTVKKLAVCCIFFLISCFCFAVGVKEETPEMSEVFEKVNYKDANRRQKEIEAIEAMMNEKPVLAMWQAKLLSETVPDDEASCALYLKSKNKVISLFNKASESGKWLEALRLFNSLSACGVKNASESGWTTEKIESRLASKIPALNNDADSKSEPKKRVADLIEGTVTVWVDLGLKIESGVGYSNKMLGSGFFIDNQGYLITNHHVINNMVDPKYEGFSRLYISLANDPDEYIPAKVVGWDKSLDLALLKAEIDSPYVFSLGSSENLRIGDKIYAIGSPLGLDRTITSGIVSASDRKLLSTAAVMQIDAAINSGNSGGPTIDENGAVQAIVFAGVHDYQGLNFAIPVEYLKIILPRLYNGGKIEHVWIGAYGRTMKNEMFQADGVEVLYVKPGSAAAKAGMSAGEVITAIDGVQVSTIEQFQNILLSKMIDSISEIECRNSENKTKKYSVYLACRPEKPGYDIYKTDLMDNYFLPLFGMGITASGEGKRKYIVTSVLKNTSADESGFSVNDKIEVTNIKLKEDNSYLFGEVYAKKRRNGYVDIFISLYSALDSPNYF